MRDCGKVIRWIEGDTIELDRATQVIVANNHVRAVFPQAAWTGTTDTQASRIRSMPRRKGPAKGPKAKSKGCAPLG